MAYKLIHKKNECIGCGACAAIAPKFWKMTDEGKSDIVKGKKTSTGAELDISDEDYPENKEAMDSCPVAAIEIKKK